MSKERFIDLDKEQFKLLQAIIRCHIPDKTVWAYGSRVTWKAGETSDLDLAIFGCGPMEICDLKETLEESDLLISVDVMDWESIPDDFKDNIRGKYVVLQERPKLEGWQEATLGEICSDISYGYTASAISEPIGPKFLRITDIVPNRINWENVPYCEISERDKEKYKLEIGDIVIARTGATTGYNKIIKINSNAVFASYLIRYKIDPSRAYPFYIGQLLQSSYWRSFVERVIGGSAQPGANAKQFASFSIALPPLPEQKAIAEVLSSLDDKIDLLHRQNKTLEHMAQTLFRKWFVNEKDDSWKHGKLEDVFTVKGGTTPSTKEKSYWNGEINWTTPRDLSNHNSIFLLDTEKRITEPGLAKISSGLLPSGTVLLSSRAPVGYLAITDINLAINQGYIAIVCDKVLSNYFVYLWCKQNIETIKNASGGTVFQEIPKAVFRQIDIAIPPEKLLSSFGQLIKPIFQKVKYNQYQIRKLENLRDTLLPKLMNGSVNLKAG